MRVYQQKAFELKSANDVLSSELERVHEDMQSMQVEHEQQLEELNKEKCQLEEEHRRVVAALQEESGKLQAVIDEQLAVNSSKEKEDELQKKAAKAASEMRVYQQKAFELKSANDVLSSELERVQEELQTMQIEHEQQLEELSKDRETQWKTVTEQIESKVKAVREMSENEKAGLLNEQAEELERQRKLVRELTEQADKLKLKSDAQELELKALRETLGPEEEVSKKVEELDDEAKERRRERVKTLREQSQFAFDEMSKRISEIRGEAEAEKKRMQGDYEQQLKERGAKMMELMNTNDALETQLETLESARDDLVSQRDDLGKQMRERDRCATLAEAELEGVSESNKTAQQQLAAFMLSAVLQRISVFPAYSTLKRSLMSSPRAGAEDPANDDAEKAESLLEASTVDGGLSDDLEEVDEEDEEDDEDEEEEHAYGLDQDGQEEWAEMLRANTLNALFTGVDVVVQNAKTAAEDLHDQVQNIVTSLDMFPQLYAQQLQELDRLRKGKELRTFIVILQRAMGRCQNISSAIIELAGRNDDVTGNLQNVLRVKALEWNLRNLRTSGQHEILLKLQTNQLEKIRSDYEDVLDQYGEQCELNSSLEKKHEEHQNQSEELKKELESAKKDMEAIRKELESAKSTAATPASDSKGLTEGSPSPAPKSMESIHQMLGEIERESIAEAQATSGTTTEGSVAPLAAGKGKKGPPPKGKGKAPLAPTAGEGEAAPAAGDALLGAESVPSEIPSAKPAEDDGSIQAPAPAAGKGKKGPPPPKGKGKGLPAPAPTAEETQAETSEVPVTETAAAETPSPEPPGEGDGSTPAPAPAAGKGKKGPPPPKGKGKGPPAPAAGEGELAASDTPASDPVAEKPAEGEGSTPAAAPAAGKGKKGPPPPKGKGKGPPDPAPAADGDAAPAAPGEGEARTEGAATGKGKGKGPPPPAGGKGPAAGPPGKGGPPGKAGKGGKPGELSEEAKAVVQGPEPPKDLVSRKLQWTQVAGPSFAKSIFAKIIDDMTVATKVDGDKKDGDKKHEGEAKPEAKPPPRTMRMRLNLDALTTTFFQRKAADKPAADDGKAKAKKFAQCLDGKKSQNVEIFLNGCGITVDQVKACIMDLDEKALPVDTLGKVREMYPAGEELETLKNFEKQNDPSVIPWGRAETFLIHLTTMPKFPIRSECCMTRGLFKDELEALSQDIITVTSCLNSIVKSAALPAIFALVMQMGNYLNYGSNKGAHKGFTLDSLAVLARVEGFSDKSYTLVRFIMDTLEGERKVREEALEDMKFCDPTSKIDFEDSVRRLGELEKAVDKVAVAVKSKDEDPAGPSHVDDEKFDTAMRSFVDSSKEQLANVRKKVEEAQEMSKTCCEMYAEKAKTPIGDTMTKFAGFRKDMEEARRQNLLAKAKKEKAEKRRVEVEKKAAAKSKAQAKAEPTAQAAAEPGSGDSSAAAAPAAGDGSESPTKDKMRTMKIKIPEKPALSLRRGLGPGSSPSVGRENLPRDQERKTLGPGMLERRSICPSSFSNAGRLSVGPLSRLSMGPSGRPDVLKVSASGRISIGVPSASRKAMGRDDIKKLLESMGGSSRTTVS